MTVIQIPHINNKRKNKVQCKCDACGITTPVYLGHHFSKMIETIRLAGWFMRPKVQGGAEWAHHCADCVALAYESGDKELLKEIVNKRRVVPDVAAFVRYRERHKNDYWSKRTNV